MKVYSITNLMILILFHDCYYFLLYLCTRPETICPGGKNRFLLAGVAPANNFEPVEMALCAGG
jgi:hypothetical protein